MLSVVAAVVVLALLVWIDRPRSSGYRPKPSDTPPAAPPAGPGASSVARRT